jgi:hypothetical protein
LTSALRLPPPRQTKIPPARSARPPANSGWILFFALGMA